MDEHRRLEHESRQAVADHLTSQPAESRQRPRPRTGQRGWTSVVHVGDRGGEGADRTTIHFANTKVFASCQLHSVSYIDWAGRSMNLLVRTWQDDDREWRVAPCGGGGSDHPRRSHPWVNFAAGFGPDAFTGGGWVVGDGAERAHLVRLTFANGAVVEDTVEGGVVLYFEPRRVATPATVDILGADGASLARYQEFGGLTDG